MASITITVNKDDLKQIDRLSNENDLSRSAFFLVKAKEAMLKYVKVNTDNSYTPRNTTHINIQGSEADINQVKQYCKKYKLNKSQWLVGNILDHSLERFQKERLDKVSEVPLTEEDKEEIVNQFSEFLTRYASLNVYKTAITQYFKNKFG